MFELMESQQENAIIKVIGVGGGGGRAGGRVAKGIRMAGRMGADRVTVMNLKVLVVDPKAGEIIVSGAVPGRRGTVLEVVSMAK